MLGKLGDNLDDCPMGNYTCPSYCDIDHIHLPKKECNGKKVKEDKSRTNKEPIRKGEQWNEGPVAED